LRLREETFPEFSFLELLGWRLEMDRSLLIALDFCHNLYESICSEIQAAFHIVKLFGGTMKHNLLILLSVVLVALAGALPVLAADPAPGSTCGLVFAGHVEEHALEIHLGAEHNPGHHEGLAGFAEHHGECP